VVAAGAVVVEAEAAGWLLLGEICVCEYGLLGRVQLTVEGLEMWKVVAGGGRRGDAWKGWPAGIAVAVVAAAGWYQMTELAVGQAVGSCVALAIIAGLLCLALLKVD
jgi:hypothetical protein